MDSLKRSARMASAMVRTSTHATRSSTTDGARRPASGRRAEGARSRMPGPIEFFCPACSHEWKEHYVEMREYVYYGSQETYTLASVICKTCGDTECLSE